MEQARWTYSKVVRKYILKNTLVHLDGFIEVGACLCRYMYSKSGHGNYWVGDG
jgi:hypothetical protein